MCSFHIVHLYIEDLYTVDIKAGQRTSCFLLEVVGTPSQEQAMIWHTFFLLVDVKTADCWTAGRIQEK